MGWHQVLPLSGLVQDTRRRCMGRGSQADLFLARAWFWYSNGSFKLQQIPPQLSEVS